MEDLFWKVFNNIYLKKKIISFLKIKKSINYKNLYIVEDIINKYNSIALLKEKVKRGEKLLFHSPFGHKYEDSDYDDSFSSIFALIKDDKEFYMNLFTNYLRYIASFDIKAKWAIKTNNLSAYKILVENFNHKITKQSLFHALDSNSIKIVNYILINHYSSIINDKENPSSVPSFSSSSPSSSSASTEILITNELNNNIWKLYLGMVDHLKLSKFYEKCKLIKLRIDNKEIKDQLENVNHWFSGYVFNSKFKNLIRDCKLLIFLYSIDLVKPKLSEHLNLVTLEYIKEIKDKYSPKIKVLDILNDKDIKILIQFYHSLNGYSLLYCLHFDQDNDKQIFNQHEINKNNEKYKINNIKLAFEYGSINYIKFWFKKYYFQIPGYNEIEKSIEIVKYISPDFYNKNEILENQKNKEKRINFINNFLDNNDESEFLYQLLPIHKFLALLIGTDDLELLKLAHLKANTNPLFIKKYKNSINGSYGDGDSNNNNNKKNNNSNNYNIKSIQVLNYLVDSNLYEIGHDQIFHWYRKGRVDLMECYISNLIEKKQFTKQQIKNSDLLPFFDNNFLNSNRNEDLSTFAYIIKNSDIYSFVETKLEYIIPIYKKRLNDLIDVIENTKFNYKPLSFFQPSSIDYLPDVWIELTGWILNNRKDDINSGRCTFNCNNSITNRVNEKEYYEYTNLYENNEIDQLISTINKNQTNLNSLDYLLSKISRCGDTITLKLLIEKTSLFNLNNLSTNKKEILLILSKACESNNINIFQFFMNNFKNVFLMKNQSPKKSIPFPLIGQSSFKTYILSIALAKDDIDIIDFFNENFGYNLNERFFYKDSLFYKYYSK
ncbi:hypothetical protein ACTFIU_007303 [Dictyostelium citrinum]